MIVDLHAHTTPRSNCSRTTLEELVASARARGLDALCITEHDVTWPDDELAEASRALGFTLIPGVELTTDVGHVLAFGPLRKPLWLGYRFEELVEEVEGTGTALVLPHPVRRVAGERALRGGRTPPAPEVVAASFAWSAVHAVEAVSTQTTPFEHELTAAGLAVVPRPSVGASDAHGPGLAGAYATRLVRRVSGAVELAEEIRAGHVVPVALESPTAAT
ncbi:MAG: PHP domain-containing protein [Acidimicrobiia bacterium]|nr:PHP domain-containing protein [Acidimicrobiia bacterium]